MHQCPNCRSSLTLRKLQCETCATGYTGRFELPRLGRLPSEQQHLAEELVLAAGNLKQVATQLGISYPTLRKRLDDLVSALGALRAADEATATALLDQVEQGGITPEAAARRIRELDGGH